MADDDELGVDDFNPGDTTIPKKTSKKAATSDGKARPNADDHIPTDVEGTARTQLKQFVERIELLTEEKQTIADDIKDIYGEAKATGFDTKIMRKIIAMRKQDKDERMEQEAILETYMIALGML